MPFHLQQVWVQRPAETATNTRISLSIYSQPRNSSPSFSNAWVMDSKKQHRENSSWIRERIAASAAIGTGDDGGDDFDEADNVADNDDHDVVGLEQQAAMMKRPPPIIVPQLPRPTSTTGRPISSTGSLAALSICSSPIAGVRPQYTPRTSVGRSVLMHESNKWELAETERRARRQREEHAGERLQMRGRSNAVEASIAREAMKNALDSSRESYRQAVDKIGQEMRAAGEDLRQQHSQAKCAWQDKGRSQPRAQDNTERVHGEVQKVRDARASHVATYSADLRRDEEELARMREERKSLVRERGQRSRRASREDMKSSMDDTMRKRAATVDETRQRQATSQSLRSQAVASEIARRTTLHHGVAGALSPGNVHEFKERERQRKAAQTARLKAQSLRNRELFEVAKREDEERRRRLHDGVRKAATDGYGDRHRTAYSSVMHSGTSLWSHSREDGQRHRFRHDLPNPRSPAGKWLRDYAQAAVSARTSRANSASNSAVTI